MNKEKGTLYYIYDALCGWCYGFGPVIKKLHENYADRINFQVLSGGMITGSRVGPLANMAAYIKQASPRVTETTGVSFGEAYLNGLLADPTYISNSVPPAVALCILKEAQPNKQVAVAHEIQRLMFQEGKSLNEPTAYLDLAEQAGMAEEVFTQKFSDPAYLAKAQEEFATVQQWGITGFPAVVLQKQDQLYLVANGFVPYDQISATVNQVLS